MHARTRTRALYSHCLGPLQRVVMRLSRTRLCDFSPSHSHTLALPLSSGTLPQQDACDLQRSDFLSSAPLPSRTHSQQIHMHAFSPTPLLYSPLLSFLPSPRSPSSLPSFRRRPELQPDHRAGLLFVFRCAVERTSGRKGERKTRGEGGGGGTSGWTKVTKPMWRVRQEGCNGGGGGRSKKPCCQEITAGQV